MDTSGHNEKYQASTVVKALDILKLLGQKDMSASEICLALDMNKTTAHRLLLTLQGENFIERDEATKKYRIGLKIVELSSSRLADVELITEARPFLLELVKTIRLPVHLGIYSAGNAVYVDKIDILPKIRMYSQIGKTIPVHCSALGKSLLLKHSHEQIADILNRYGMPAFTPNTITDPNTYLREIKEGQEKGYTTDNGEHEENVCCIAAPIYNFSGHIVAAISVSGFNREETDATLLLPYLLSATQKISSRLGSNNGANNLF